MATTSASVKHGKEEKKYVDLVKGKPSDGHLNKALPLLTQALTNLQKSDYGCGANILKYGPDVGSVRFRCEVAAFLSQQYGDTVLPEHVIQTAAASQGIKMACTLLLPPGAPIYVEDPTYFLNINMLRSDMHLHVIPVPTDENGVKVDELERLMVAQGKSRDTSHGNYTFTSMVLVVTVHHNPKGICYSKERCEALVRLARAHNTLLFSEDIYNMLHYDESTPAPPRLLTYDNKSDPDYKGHVISNGTFSKILGPGLRVGWMETQARIVKLFAGRPYLDSGGCVNHFTAEVVAEVLSLGLLQKHLSMLCNDYGRMLRWICQELRAQLPMCSFHQPQGGYFIWLELPIGSDVTELARLSEDEYSLLLLPGNRCSPSGSYSNCIRIPFSHLEEHELDETVRRLAGAVKSYLAMKAAADIS